MWLINDLPLNELLNNRNTTEKFITTHIQDLIVEYDREDIQKTVNKIKSIKLCKDSIKYTKKTGATFVSCDIQKVVCEFWKRYEEEENHLKSCLLDIAR